jgi:hypothetical protein
MSEEPTINDRGCCICILALILVTIGSNLLFWGLTR